MLFMNKKEEVLDIELTPYGKHLLSNGKLKPVYYAFFDDNILYDIQYVTGNLSSFTQQEKDLFTSFQDKFLKHIKSSKGRYYLYSF